MDVHVEKVWVKTPERIYHTKLNDEKLNAELFDTIQSLDYMNGTKGLAPLQAEVTKLVDMSKSPWNKLKFHVDKLARIAVVDHNNQNENTAYRSTMQVWHDKWCETLETISMWVAKYDSTKGHYAKMHDHFPALYTFCYYLEDPDEPLVDAPELIVGTKPIAVEVGKLYLFRGDVDHGVAPKKFDGKRYVIAGSVNNT